MVVDVLDDLAAPVDFFRNFPLRVRQDIYPFQTFR